MKKQNLQNKMNKIYERSAQNIVWNRTVLDSTFQRSSLPGQVQKRSVHRAKGRLTDLYSNYQTASISVELLTTACNNAQLRL